MNDTGLPLPPRRALPPDVRERMRRRVLAEAPARRRGPVVVAAAAAVVLLAGGGVVYLTRGGESDPEVVTPARPDPTKVATTYGKPADSDVAECDGMASTLSVTMPGRRILLGDGRFCEITYTRVSVSKAGVEPTPFGDGGAAVLWKSPTGVVVGRAPQGTEAMTVASNPASISDVPKIAELLPGGLFVLRTVYPADVLSFRSGDTTTTARLVEADVPAPEPAASKDVWPSGMNDPTHPDNLVARCFDLWLTDGPPFPRGAPASFDGPTGWQPSVLVGKADAAGVLVVYRDSDTAYCGLRDGVLTDFHWPTARGRSGLPFTLGFVSDAPESGLTVLAGAVNPKAVTRLEFTGPGGAHAEAELGVGAFAVNLPGVFGLPDITVKAVGRGGDVLYEGPLG